MSEKSVKICAVSLQPNARCWDLDAEQILHIVPAGRGLSDEPNGPQRTLGKIRSTVRSVRNL
jgi:hypothetical protein